MELGGGSLENNNILHPTFSGLAGALEPQCWQPGLVLMIAGSFQVLGLVQPLHQLFSFTMTWFTHLKYGEWTEPAYHIC